MAGLSLLFACFANAAVAQTASVSGKVVDPASAAVTDARVTMTSPAGQRQDTRTGGDGSFSFNKIALGSYTLRIEATGFSSWSQNISAAAQGAPLTIALQVAGLSEAISVVGSAPSTLDTPSLTGSRLGLTPLATPASVSIISGEVIRERGDQSIAAAKTRAVGVTMQGDPGNGGGSVVARGFGGVGSVMQLFDGDQLFVGAGTVTFPFDPWTVERIEVLGGPSSVLYGNGSIGGAVNVVPRKPNPFSREGSVRLAAGSFGTYRGAVDAAGPITPSTSYRFDVSTNRSGGWVTNNPSNSTALSGSLRRQMTPTLILTLSEDFGYQQPGEYFGTPTINGVIEASLRNVNYNVSDSEIWYRDNWTQVKLEWQPSANVRFRSGVHLLATNRHWRDAEEFVFDPSTRLIARDSYIEILHTQRQYGNRTDVTLTNRVGGKGNTLSAGFDYNFVSFQHTNNSPYGGVSATDLHNSTPGLFLHVDPTLPKYRTHTYQTAFFAEDRLQLTSRVSLVGGARFDRYAAERTSLVNGVVSNRTYTPPSGRGGVVFAPRTGLSLYGQVATATDTIGDIISNNVASMLLNPTQGRQVEAGVKQSLWGQRAEWTVAGYHIVKKDLLAPVFGRPGVVQQIGSQSSRGVEMTAAIKLPGGLTVDANAAFLDARYDDFGDESDGAYVSRAGKTPPSTPERSVNLWLTWNAPQGWQFKGGVRSVGPRYWDNTNTTKIPPYTVVDLGVRKRLGQRTSIDVHVYNLGDELYATDFYYNGYAPQWMLGTPRSAEVSVTYGF